MKIAIATANLDIHGVAAFTFNLCQSLQAAGHAVTVVTVRRGQWWSRLAELAIQGECIVQRHWDSVVHHVKRLAAWLTAQQFDLLVVNVGSINSRPLQLCLHLLPDSLPVVVLLHNDDAVVYDVAGINCAAWNCAVAVSPKVQQTAQARFPQQAIHFIPHGIPLPTADQLCERQLWKTPLRLLFVGRLDNHQKGILRLPAIIAACHNQGLAVQLTVIGDGPDRERLAQLCAATGVMERIDLVGFQPSETVFAQMRTHHLLLLPSNFEGLGMVIQEAQANGCVPIASRLHGVTDTIIMDGVNGALVEPTDIDGFVAAIRPFMIAECWQHYSQAALNHAQQHYAVQWMGERYVTLFEGLQRGLYPLPMARSTLCKAYRTPFVWQEYLPKALLFCKISKS